MTGQSYGTNNELWNSPADWISLLTDGNGTYEDHPTETDGGKVIILDTDHLQNNGVAGRSWVWKCFTRGYNPIYMDRIYQETPPLYGANPGASISSTANDVRAAMGYTRGYAERMDLINMTPQGSLSPIGNDDGYVLANVGQEYLVYRPVQGDFTVNLAANTYTVEWFNPANADTVPDPDRLAGGDPELFHPPFSQYTDAVLYLKAVN